jgi:hypothetical protein
VDAGISNYEWMIVRFKDEIAAEGMEATDANAE